MKMWMHQWFLRTKTAWRSNSGMGVIELILIIVVIFTIYMGCK